MKELDPIPGSHIYDVLKAAVEQSPAHFTFNGWDFTTQQGETLGDARQRFQDQHGIEVLTPEESRERNRRELEKMRSDQASAIAAAKMPIEAEMREMKAPWLKTSDELVAYIQSLVTRPHDYGTCVYTMSLAAVATLNYVAGRLGTTGFQVSCADLDILRQTRGLDWGKVLNYNDLLFPQYCNSEHFPSAQDLLAMPKVRSELAKMAREKLAETPMANGNVLAHWQMLAKE